MSKKLILAVDDNRPAVELCKILLELDELYTVETRYDGDTAVVWLSEHVPDLVILNYYMKNVNGDEVLRWMRSEARLAQVPVIFTSGLYDRALKVAGDLADAVLSIPFDPEELLELMAALL